MAGHTPRYAQLKLPFRFEGDPPPSSSFPLDDRDERVYEHIVEVRPKPVPALELTGKDIPSLVLGDEDVLTLAIRNVGEGTASNILLRACDKLGSGQANILPELPPGSSGVLQLEVTPKASGNVGVTFTLSYFDQFGGQHEAEIRTRLRVVRPGENRPVFNFHQMTISGSAVVARAPLMGPGATTGGSSDEAGPGASALADLLGRRATIEDSTVPAHSLLTGAKQDGPAASERQDLRCPNCGAFMSPGEVECHRCHEAKGPAR